MKRILLFVLIFAAIYFGGFDFLKTKIDEFNNPPRDKMIENAKFFGNFSRISSDYIIGHTLGMPDYKILMVKHKPSNQKIFFMTIKASDTMSYSTFGVENVKKSLQKFTNCNILQKFFDFPPQISPKATLQKGKSRVKFVNFELKTKNLPFKNSFGFLGIYEAKKSENDSAEKSEKPCDIMVLSFRNTDKFSSEVVKSLLQKIDF